MAKGKEKGTNLSKGKQPTRPNWCNACQNFFAANHKCPNKGKTRSRAPLRRGDMPSGD